VKTAREWKAGRRKPSLQALRLFGLYRDRRVLTAEWRGWVVKPNAIVDPDGNETGRSQLFGYFLVLQWASELASRDPATLEHYHQILRRA
jgi:hypothetical protein